MAITYYVKHVLTVKHGLRVKHVLSVKHGLSAKHVLSVKHGLRVKHWLSVKHGLGPCNKLVLVKLQSVRYAVNYARRPPAHTDRAFKAQPHFCNHDQRNHCDIIVIHFSVPSQPLNITELQVANDSITLHWIQPQVK